MARHRRSHVTGAQFRVLAAQATGQDLTTFFTHWLDETAKPAATAENGLTALRLTWS